MAKSSAAKRRGQSGGTLFSVLAGLLLGLVLAAAVAVYVARSPTPFVDRVTRGPDPSLPDPGNAPDPNRSLYGRGAPAGTAPVSGTPPPVPRTPVTVPDAVPEAPLASAPAPSAPAPARPAAPPASAPAADPLGQLVANLDRGAARAPAPAAAEPPRAAPAGRYLLQVGAFRVLEEAESLKARLTFLGFDVRVQQAQVNGVLVNRVQVGPYARLDDMNRARARLAENRIPSTVVRQ